MRPGKTSSGPYYGQEFNAQNNRQVYRNSMGCGVQLLSVEYTYLNKTEFRLRVALKFNMPQNFSINLLFSHLEAIKKLVWKICGILMVNILLILEIVMFVKPV